MNHPIFAANWKMNHGPSDARAFMKTFLTQYPRHYDRTIIFFPPAASIETVDQLAEGRSDILVGAQNIYWEDTGAFTGEISAPMLTELDAHGVVLGHSERREHYNETDRALQLKVVAALDAGLKPILCVGETEEERERGDTERKLRHQVNEGLEKVAIERLADVVVAYEPIWAIGTGKVATVEQAQDAIAFVRALVEGFDKAAGQAVRILYGGSLKPDNAEELLGLPDVDGALVGGASLDPASFAEIVEIARKLASAPAP